MENLEMSGNLTVASEMSGILLKVREVSGKKIWSGKSGLKLFIVSSIYLHPLHSEGKSGIQPGIFS